VIVLVIEAWPHIVVVVVVGAGYIHMLDSFAKRIL
jgi:hypothetical protein